MDKTIILAIVQGLTEFLPISSSGHLVVFNKLLGAGGGIGLYAVLHLGTMFSVIVYFSKDIYKMWNDVERLRSVLVACFVTGIIVLLGKEYFERFFNSCLYVATAMLVNGLLLMCADKFSEKGGKDKVSTFDALIMGLVQAISIIPGISRSGSTISTLFFRGVSKEEAFRFSFISAIPLIFGAFILEMHDIGSMSACFKFFSKYSLSCLIAFLTGLCALKLLSYMIKKSKFYLFGWYCICFATFTLLVYLM